MRGSEWPLTALPIISVPPVRRPKLDATNTKYSFEDEKELMKDKIRTALRIAIYYDHPDICFGAYGCGPIFRNPTREVATMFKDILFFEEEFKGQFSNVVFAFESGSSGSSSSSSGSLIQKSDMQIFKEVFDPAKLHNTAYKWLVSRFLSQKGHESDYWLKFRSKIAFLNLSMSNADAWLMTGGWLIGLGSPKGFWMGFPLSTRRLAKYLAIGSMD